MPLYSTSISDRKRRKPHFYDSRLFIYIFRFFSLASGEFWTFLLLFSALCPFSPALFHIFLWLPENFGLFPAFSVLYVHSHRLCSVLPSGFRMFLDFFPAFLGLMSIFTCSVQCFSLVSRSFWTFFLAFLCFMSIFTCPAPYFPLVSGCFWTFLLLFSTLYTFSPAQLHISLWLPDVFGLFPAFSVLYVHFLLLSSIFLSGFRMILDFFTAFSRLYVHFHLLGSVFPSSFRMILDFFTAFSVLYVHFLLPGSVFPSSFRMFLDFFLLFLCFMSILSCPAPYFPLVSGCFWTFLLLFSTLYTFSPAQLHISLWLPDVFGLFPAFSVLYVYFLLPGSVLPSGFRMILDFFTLFLSFISIWKSIEVSRLRRARKSPTCVEFRNLQTTKSSESSELRKAVLIRIKRSAIICPAREIHMSE